MSSNAPKTNPVPAPMAAALEQLRKTLKSPDGASLDPLTASWADIERGVVPLLGGAFSPQKGGHLDVVFMLASALAERLRLSHGAFWFQNRSTPHGATLGFPNGVLVFSPFETVFEAIGRSKLTEIEAIATQLRAAVERSAGSLQGKGTLGPADYQRIFDPGLVQFFAFDPKAAAAVLDATAESTVRDFEHGFSKLANEIPAEVRTQISREVLGALKRLPASSTLAEQLQKAPQLIEFVTLAMAGAGGTGIAPAEFWQQLLLPLLHVGAPETFAAPDEDELEPWKEGADPLLLYVDVVPYQTPAADEDGLLGVFPADEVGLLDPRWNGAQGVRLLAIDPALLRTLLDGFDPEQVKASVAKFAEMCTAAAGPSPAPPKESGQPELIDLVIMLAEDLRQIVKLADEKGLAVGLRYATESEASSEPVLGDLRRAIREPRIVLG